MKTKNVIIGILGILLVGALIWGYKSNKTVIDNKIAAKNENVKSEVSEEFLAIENKVKTDYVLTKARVALLKSLVALDIDDSEHKAEVALDNALNYLSEAKLTADNKTKVKIDSLIIIANKARKSITQKKDDASNKVSVAAGEAKEISEKYTAEFNAEKEERIANVNKKNYELQAEEALMRAKIAAQLEKTYSQAQAYLEEAKEWYNRISEYGTQEIKASIVEIQNDIEKAQTYLKEKDKKARKKIDEMIQKAQEINNKE